MRNPRLYSLYKRSESGHRWERLSVYAFPKYAAVRFFQDQLIRASLSGDREHRLRPVKN